ncbi:hypothetical protein LEP1GSC016_2237 [Leptospira borgpetersenii serovar Hardjo-bovis str. Sponselee]|uniref:Uncharacterized protein n=2 Tax=Leptospira borgpetersenii TaxID=174 RepID=M6BT41_LEPBO|nr:hypothetical protein LEP1GSC016_2237 [Leptospira borgpetersenii serovar Hardjo-bovis str. Sponselee]EMO61021.1 hypothetical protein LEP1GSC133_2645 [Leptospira borgpetersenii serovar Pomona str. 200901868]
MSLFQKLKFFFKKPVILDSVEFYEDFYIFAKSLVNFDTIFMRSNSK